MLKFFAFALVFASVFTYPVYAQETDEGISVDGGLYRYSDKEDYAIPTGAAAEDAQGSLVINGDVEEIESDFGYPAFVSEDEGSVTFSYAYGLDMMKAGYTSRHITNESKKTVGDIKLDKKIGSGAVIVQTSFDGERWYTAKRITDIPNNLPKFYTTQDTELINGCHYRIIVAYRTEKMTGSKKILFMDKNDYEYEKNTEVYQFYISTPQTEANKGAENEKTYNLGTTVNAGNNAYTGSDAIDTKDLHYGWDLGTFRVSGFTDRTDDNVFLKNVGDKVTLWFNLKQDTEKLNGNENLVIAEEKKGQDGTFQTALTNMGHGTLLIRYTDFEGNVHDPVMYKDYLVSVASPGADTKVQLLEEGDYDVALDYKVKNDKFIDKNEYYRMAFSFKVRNGNCMVYPFDVSTKAELTNNASTENGFYLDLAKSRYLKINVTMSRWIKGENGYTEDVRYNRPAKDGDKYTDEGIYTIEVSNPTTGKSTVKKIYVGSDNVLKAAVNTNNAQYSVNDIARLVDTGAQIDENGAIIMPDTQSEPKTEIVTETENITQTEVQTEPETVTDEMIYITTLSEQGERLKNGNYVPIYALLILSAAVLAGLVVVYRRYGK